MTVASKTSNHRYFGTGSGSAYFIDGIESPFLTLLPGKTYRFTQEDGSNSSHPVLFYYQADRTTQYTINVTTSGTAGSAGAYTEIVVTDITPVVLHYQCSNHGYMGNAAQFSSNIVDTPYQITARSGINVSGVSTLGTVKISSGIITATTGIVTYFGDGSNLQGIQASSIVGVTSFATNAGIATFATNAGIATFATTAGIATFATTAGIATFATNAGISTNVIGGIASVTQLNVSGVSTLGIVTSSQLYVSGVVTASQYFGDGSQLTGVTGVQIVTQDPISTPVFLTFANNAGVTSLGVVTTGSNSLVFIPSTGNLGIGTTNPTSKLDVRGDVLVSGVSTLGAVKISSGIITASSGIVTYFGDGQYLDLSNNPSTGIGIGTIGGLVGYGITFLNFTGASVSNTFYNSNTGIATIFFDGGTIGIGTEFPSSSINGELFFSAEFGRLFVYYDEAVVGVGTDAFWIDAAPFNIDLSQLDSLSLINLTVSNNTNLNNLIVGSVVSSGIVTAVDFNSTSDKKLKYNVETVENALDTVNSLRGVSFNWKENDRKSYGVIAQELEEFLPDLVSDGEIKTVNYNGIIGVLIEAVKELKKEIEYLKNL